MYCIALCVLALADIILTYNTSISAAQYKSNLADTRQSSVVGFVFVVNCFWVRLHEKICYVMNAVYKRTN
jgi:hypothetical protein